MHETIFDPLGMTHAWMHGFSTPKEQSEHPAAGLFLKALTSHRIVSEATLERMITDDVPMGFPTVGFDYGYSIWKLKSIPLLVPSDLFCWGCVGVTGAAGR